ncbi:MAG: phosphatase PAP2 family protein [Muribaculaceae bacterium]|nr:phosphatase PAP2 family protein [Muribaculaceae bacterium]
MLKKPTEKTTKLISGVFKLRILILSLTLMLSGFLTPQMRADDSSFTPSSAQKAVRTSTDVVLIALPAAALATTLIMQDWEGLKEGAISAGVTVAATLALKYTVKENRPDGSNCHSFPSGHASVTFAAATFIGKRYGWKYSIPAYALSAYTAWGRVYGKKHHWWDVAAGAAIGAASSFIFTHPYMKKHEVALIPIASETNAGILLSFAF